MFVCQLGVPSAKPPTVRTIIPEVDIGPGVRDWSVMVETGCGRSGASKKRGRVTPGRGLALRPRVNENVHGMHHSRLVNPETL